MGTASGPGGQSPEAEHGDCEHGEPGTSTQAVSSQHAMAVEQGLRLSRKKRSQVGCVQALEM